MHSLSFVSFLFIALVSVNTAFASPRSARSRSRDFYTRPHSLGEDYKFDTREWHSVNVTDLSCKYEDKPVAKRSDSEKSITGGSAVHLLNAVWNGLKGLGDPSTVKITWYTGHDLLNPSCWKNSGWHPTDESFASALTLEGWDEQPKCFKFMELCNGNSKCVYVRKVDTCAGCAPNSHHVDLTKAAFSSLANLDEGVLNVNMREATDPEDWFEDLWGPKQ